MKKTLPAVFLVLLFACDHGHKQSSHDESHEDHPSTTGLKLNKGERWQTDPHTRKTMAAIIGVVGKAEPDEVEDFQRLGAELHEFAQTLIRGCTMEGPAHNNLHVFLGRFIPAVGSLQKSKSVAEGIAILVALRGTLEDYSTYFD